MYSVHEHRYYIPGSAAPVMEYCVCEAEVRGYFTGGYTEIRLVGPNPEGHMTPYFYKLSEIGKKIFFTPKDAALLAQQMTEKHERTWGWMGDPPILCCGNDWLKQKICWRLSGPPLAPVRRYLQECHMLLA